VLVDVVAARDMSSQDLIVAFMDKVNAVLAVVGLEMLQTKSAAGDNWLSLVNCVTDDVAKSSCGLDAWERDAAKAVMQALKDADGELGWQEADEAIQRKGKRGDRSATLLLARLRDEGYIARSGDRLIAGPRAIADIPSMVTVGPATPFATEADEAGHAYGEDDDDAELGSAGKRARPGDRASSETEAAAAGGGGDDQDDDDDQGLDEEEEEEEDTKPMAKRTKQRLRR
jgi:hypothetical protein